MELAEPACVGLGGLARVELVPGCPPHLERQVEGAVDRLDPGSCGREATARDACHAPPLVRELLTRREVHPRELEEPHGRRCLRRRSRARPRRDRGAASSAARRGRRSSAPRHAARPSPDRTASGSRCRPRRTRRRRARPRARDGIAARGSDVRPPSDAAAWCSGTRSSTARATSSTRSTSRVTSRARHVGTVASQPSSSKSSDSRIVRCSSSATSSPIRRRARSGRSTTRGRSGRPAWTSACPTSSAPARSTSSRLARIAAGSAAYGSTPFSHLFDPSVRSARRSEVFSTPIGSKFAASSSTSLVSSATSESRPPMIAASATARSPSVIKRSDGSSSRCVPSSVRSVSPDVRAAHDDPAAGQLRAVEGVERAAPDVHHVVRDVDDVRDRAHPGEVEPRAKPLGRRADDDVPEDPSDVARAAVEVVDADVHLDGPGRRGVVADRAAAARRRRAPPPRGRARPARAGRVGSSSASRRAPGRRAAARRRAASPARARPGAA